MKVLAIMGSYRKNGTIDTITRQVIEGAKAAGAETEKIDLVDCDIAYCRNCFTCYMDPDPHLGKCAIQDDMGEILKKVLKADSLVLAAPVNMATVNALMKTFMERCCYTLAGPTGRFLWYKGVPEPRNKVKKRAAVITSAGVCPAWLKPLISYPLYQLSGTCVGHFNADVIGSMFVGSVQNRPLSKKELDQAFSLGQLLAAEKLPLLKSVTAGLRSRIEPALEIATSLIKV